MKHKTRVIADTALLASSLLLLPSAAASAAALTANFNADVGPVRRELHSSGFGPQINSCPQKNIDDIKSMGFKASRTHDWAGLNPCQRVCDYFFIFPMMHLDAKDPKNYYFDATDYLLKRTREEVGHDVYFRLGTSIEHAKKHFNAMVPADFDKVAETFAGTVRHYNRGWANGYKWNIKYWEIWNEPDGTANMWTPRPDIKIPPGTSFGEHMRALYCKFFVTCCKRLKDEFGDTIKVGGPGLCFYQPSYFRALFDACKAAGVAPDFIAWHCYSDDPESIARSIREARALCDEYGFTKCELSIDEWHYLDHEYSWKCLWSDNPDDIRKSWTGARAHNGIDSSCFNLAVLSQFQTSKLDLGFYYGCRSKGDWGYMDEHRRKWKVFYGLQIFGDFVRTYTRLCAAKGNDPANVPVVTVLAGKSADGKKKGLLVSDYRTRAKELVVDVQGVPADAKVTARIHDYTRDLAPADFTFADGKLTLRKADTESAAFFVEFE